MVPPNNLGLDLNGKAVNETQHRGIIGLLMYLTANRLDIQFSTCLYARYKANPKESHLIAVKRIFKYLKDTPNLASTLMYSESASGRDTLVTFTAEADLKISDPKHSLPPKQGSMELDSPKNDQPIQVSSEDEADLNKETEETSTKLKDEKETAEAEAAYLNAQHSYLNVQKLTKLRVTSLQHELVKLVKSSDLGQLIHVELKLLRIKMNELTEFVNALKKYVQNLHVDFPSDILEIPN
ncbi:hypothetical protein Tco_0909502 [Tanacetum coccineum]|uniref:Uncharacterized protein n=1 Tax=Tanacetum coccineum TaxID=301880 RepID=A0ABQ5CS55_9ASTR